MYENESKLINLDKFFIGTNLEYSFSMDSTDDIEY